MTSRDSRFLRSSSPLVLTLALLLTALAGLVGVQDSAATVIVIDGDWTVTGTDNVYDGIIFKVDGNITVESGAILDVRNGGLIFLEDSNHIYYLDIRDGGGGHGQLILDNSFLTTEPNQISDYLKLDVIVSGTLTLKNGSLIKHPGTLTTSGDAAVEVRSSKITGFTSEEIADYIDLNEDDNNDAPVMSFTGTSTVLVASSIIDRLYENANDPGPDSRYNITLRDSAVLTVIDSYVGVDFHPDGARHNTVAAGDTSTVYVYNMTLDEAQSGLVTPENWLPALGLQGPRQVLTLTAYPTLIGEKDTSGEPLSDINSDDGVYYTVADGETLYMEEFDADGMWRLINATLIVEYWTDAGWSGSNAIRYGLEGEALQNVISVTDTGGVGGITTATGILSGVDTFADARFLDVDFNNNDGTADAVHFDYMAVQVFYEEIDSQASIFIHRWLDIDVVDRFGSAVAGAYVESRILPSGQLAYYPQNGGGNVPSTEILDYLGATSGDFNVTDATGRAMVPLLTEWVNRSLYDPTMPNSHFMGNYRIRSSFSGEVSSEDHSFSSYPSLTRSLNVLETTATLKDLVWPAQDNTYVWSSTAVIDYDVQLDGNLRVTGDVTIAQAQLTILQGDPVAGRHYLIIEGTGSLTVREGGLSSNLPLVVYLRDSGSLSAVDSQLLLNTADRRGIIYGEHSAVISIEGGALQGDITALGDSASLKGVTISGSDLSIDAAETSYVWDPVFEQDVGLALLSDDGDVATVDFDIRNVTISESLNGSIVFQGTQYVQLTNVTFPGEYDWWTGRIANEAKAGLYWWLKVNAVDGLGDTVYEVNITLERLNPDNLNFEPIPSPGPDDLYQGIYTPTHIEAPTGTILYRALAQERFASRGWSNSTYRADGFKVIEAQTFYPEEELAASMVDNVDMDLVFFNWPDLSFQESDVVFSRIPVQEADVDVQVTVSNLGKADALGAMVELYDNGILADSATLDILVGSSESVILGWRPQVAGSHTLRVLALTRNDTESNTDLIMSNNIVELTVVVLTKPDLELRPSEFETVRAVEGRAFTVPVVVHNIGNTAASDFDVGLYLDSVDPGNLLASAEGLAVPPGGNISVLMEAGGVAEAGNYTLIVVADASGVLPEINEDNNRAQFTLEVVPPEGQVFITVPDLGKSFNLGDRILVSGTVNTPTGQPVPDMRVTVLIRDPQGTIQASKAVLTNQDGEFGTDLQLPSEAPSGSWTLVAAADAQTIQAASVAVGVAKPVPWYDIVVPMVGLPLWMLLAALGAFVLLALLIMGYMKGVGIGRLVECGECGAFISESSTSCPKCGTEFEREMVKCSSCHAWIPMDVKKCPECGVEFASGKFKTTADYRDRMRKQYMKVVEKYRAQAKRALGRKPSEKEFQEWWRRQPTYVTFEKWLKEEEEMRKMGSKACSSCGALNSVTAVVCHKCGSMMPGQTPPGGRPGQPPAPPPLTPPAPEKKKADRPVMKKILKKPFARKK